MNMYECSKHIYLNKYIYQKKCVRIEPSDMKHMHDSNLIKFY